MALDPTGTVQPAGWGLGTLGAPSVSTAPLAIKPQFSPEQIAQMRKEAMALQQPGTEPIKHWTQGLAQLVRAIQGNREADFAREQELTGRQQGAEAIGKIYAPYLSPTGGAAPAATSDAGTTPATTDASAPRGMRNNNPLNIEDGAFAQSQPGYTGSDGRFAKFETQDHGTSAASSLLDVYNNKHGLNTVAGIVGRWAPASDNNNTKAYAADVAAQLGIGPNDPIPPEMRPRLIAAMAKHENGVPLAAPAAVAGTPQPTGLLAPIPAAGPAPAVAPVRPPVAPAAAPAAVPTRLAYAGDKLPPGMAPPPVPGAIPGMAPMVNAIAGRPTPPPVNPDSMPPGGAPWNPADFMKRVADMEAAKGTGGIPATPPPGPVGGGPTIPPPSIRQTPLSPTEQQMMAMVRPGAPPAAPSAPDTAPGGAPPVPPGTAPATPAMVAAIGGRAAPAAAPDALKLPPPVQVAQNGTPTAAAPTAVPVAPPAALAGRGLPSPLTSPTGQITQEQLTRTLANPWVPESAKAAMLQMIQQRGQPQSMPVEGGTMMYNAAGQKVFIPEPKFGTVKIGSAEVPTVSHFDPASGRWNTTTLAPGGGVQTAPGAGGGGLPAHPAQAQGGRPAEPDLSTIGGIQANEAAQAGAKKAAEAGGEAHAKYYDSLHKGLAGTAMIAAQQKQNIDLLRQVAASPDFTPGSGSELALGIQRMAAGLGIKPEGAAPRELFNQIATRILADQISGIKSMASETGETGGRIFKSMLDLEEKANITPEDTAAGINAKLNLIDNAGNLMMRWGDMADDYVSKHGKLDSGFDKELRSEIGKARIPNAVPGAEKTESKAAAPAAGGPAVGAVDSGYKFKGGDPKKKENWEKVQ